MAGDQRRIGGCTGMDERTCFYLLYFVLCSLFFVLCFRPPELYLVDEGSPAKHKEQRTKNWIQNLITVSGPPSMCSVSTNRMCFDSVVITSECVRLPAPKNLTPFNSAPSVTPVAAKMIFFPGARSSVS